MSIRYEIPLVANPQTFTISLAGINYKLLVQWNHAAQSWTLDISDSNGNAIISGIPLITGADLLEQYEYLNFGGQLICETDGDATAIPTFTNLGTTSHLYFVVP